MAKSDKLRSRKSMGSKPVTLNVGGTIFETGRNTLNRYPDTLLGSLSASSPNYDSERNQFFFDRNPEFFNEILDLYRTGTLHLPPQCCGAIIRQELEFWEIPKEYIGECCIQTYLRFETDMEVINTVKKVFEMYDFDFTNEECEKMKLKRILREIWHLLDQPQSSVAAQVFNYVFLAVVILSMISFTLGSHPDFRDHKLTFEELLFIRQNLSYRFFDDLDLNNPKQIMFGTSLPSKVLQDIDLFCMSFFTLEFILHFLACPKKKYFFRNPLNVMDPILLVAMWTTFGLEQDLELLVKDYQLVQLYLVMKAFVVLRLFRFFRLMKVYAGLRILVMSIRASLNELFLLLMCFLVAALFFASFMYYAEFNVPDTFPHIFVGLWWAIVTMTTVGYGDTYPTSTTGHIVGSACAFCGLLIVAMPIAVVATNFSDYHEKNKQREVRKSMIENDRKEKSRKSESARSLRKVVPINIQPEVYDYEINTIT